MSEPAKPGYTVKELADRAGVTPRTIYYYVSEGLLPPPAGAGPATTYRDEHLARLRLIRRLKDEYLPLAEIRRRLAELSPREVDELLGAPPPAPPRESAREYLARVLGARDSADRRATAPAPSARAPRASDGEPGGAGQRAGAPPAVSTTGRRVPGEVDDLAPVEQADWRRVRIGPDVELHVRRDAPSTVRKKLSRIAEAIRQILLDP